VTIVVKIRRGPRLKMAATLRKCAQSIAELARERPSALL